MKLISIHEDPERVNAIDRLVSEGAFGSRAEAYRTGALLMITVKEARRLAKLDQLEPALLGSNVRSLLKSLETENLEAAKNHLERIKDALDLRAILSTLFGEEDLRDSYETTADGFERYRDVLAKFTHFDSKTKKRIIADLRRDLIALNAQPRSLIDLKQLRYGFPSSNPSTNTSAVVYSGTSLTPPINSLFPLAAAIPQQPDTSPKPPWTP
jgi:Arc/MetJ-type ribon-helix-helix transcriptional regulator